MQILCAGAVLNLAFYKPIKIKLSGATSKVWFNGTLKINQLVSTIAAGAFGLSGEKTRFKNILIGYDNSNPTDDDIDDAGDDIVYDDVYTRASCSMRRLQPTTTAIVSTTPGNNGSCKGTP